MKSCRPLLCLASILLMIAVANKTTAQGSDRASGTQADSIRINSSITRVQPMTGIVLWSSHELVDTDAIALEYRYCGYNEVIDENGAYDWSVIDRTLDEVAGRNHQAILRFHFVYPGRTTTVPESIKRLDDYRETIAKSEGQTTHFCDWSHPALQQMTLDFYTAFAQRYEKDRRLALLQTGFGLWAEYHIYDGPLEFGKTFPDRAFQTKFLKHLADQFRTLPWAISIDAGDSEYTPIEGNESLLALSFGLFDDSFLCKPHKKENEVNWRIFGPERWQRAIAGGEFSYYNKRDQRLALAPGGPNGESFEDASRRFHLTYIIGSDQPQYQSMNRIREAGMAMGYRFRIVDAKISADSLKLVVTNDGIAPIYRDAFFSLGSNRAQQPLKSSQSLQGLLPGESLTVEVPLTPGELFDPSRLKIECAAILKSQTIEFEADLIVKD